MLFYLIENENHYQYYLILFNIIQYYPVLFNIIQYYLMLILFNIIENGNHYQYYPILSNIIQYYSKIFKKPEKAVYSHSALLPHSGKSQIFFGPGRSARITVFQQVPAITAFCQVPKFLQPSPWIPFSIASSWLS